MPHFSPERYAERLRELRNVDSTVLLDWDRPDEVLSFLHVPDGEEVLRLPSRHATPMEQFERRIPEHLNAASTTFDARLQLLPILKGSTDMLDSCLRGIPEMRAEWMKVQQSDLTSERLSQQCDIVTLTHEYQRQIEVLVFQASDFSIQQTTRMLMF